MKLPNLSQYIYYQLILFTISIHVIYGENAVDSNQSDKLINDPKCSKIKELCYGLEDDDDLHVLECLQSLNSKDLTSIKRDCQQVISYHTDKVIDDKYVEPLLKASCGEDIESFTCETKTDKGNYFSCILEHREDIKSNKCLKLIQRLESVAFFDLRWVTQFLQICDNDIKKLQCNIKNTNAQVIFSSHLLLCLQNGLFNLDTKCRKQVLKLTEIQADNIKLDPELYYACAADRLRFCRDYHPGKYYHQTKKLSLYKYSLNDNFFVQKLK